MAEDKSQIPPADKAEQDALDEYERTWDRDKEYRRNNYERQMQINASFYLGRQNIKWGVTRNTIIDSVSSASRFAVVDNRLMPMVRSVVSRQITKPGVQVLPESSTHEAKNKAKFKERILDHIERVNNFTNIRQSMSLWGAVCGDAFPIIDWDDAAGESYADDSGMYAEGEVKVTIGTPWEIWEDAAGSRVGSWGRHVWHGRILPVASANEIYKKEREKLGIESFNDDADSYTSAISRSGIRGMHVDPTQSVTTTDRSLEEPGVMVRRLYILKSKLHPEGKEVVIINGRLIREGPLKWFPFVHYPNKLFFDRFRGDTDLREAIPLQVDRNRIRSSISEYIHVMGHGKWLVHKGVKLQKSALTDHSGEVVFWEGGQPPTPITVPSLPADIWQSLAINDSAIEDIFANRPTSQGKRETGVESGVHASILAEEDDRQHAPSATLYEKAWVEIYKKCLDLASRKYKPGRVISVVGEDLESYVETIPNEMLEGPNEVHIVTGSSLPKNKTVRAEMIRRDFAEGMYGNPEDPRVRRKALKLRDAGIVDDIFDNDRLDEARAYEENQKIINSKNGQDIIDQNVIVNDWDNDPVHLEVVERELKGTKFEEYELHVQKGLVDHWLAHMDKMQKQMEQAMQQQMMMEGKTEGGSTPIQGATDVLQGAGGTQGGNSTSGSMAPL